jgi:hypothetical protein
MRSLFSLGRYSRVLPVCSQHHVQVENPSSLAEALVVWWGEVGCSLERSPDLDNSCSLPKADIFEALAQPTSIIQLIYFEDDRLDLLCVTDDV